MLKSFVALVWDLLFFPVMYFYFCFFFFSFFLSGVHAGLCYVTPRTSVLHLEQTNLTVTSGSVTVNGMCVGV